jgi:hypothetical protein
MQRLEAPRAWPNKAIKCGGHGSASRGGRRGIRRDQGRIDSNYTNGRAKAVNQSPAKLWPHRDTPYYSMKTRARTMISSRTGNSTRLRHMDESRGTTWRGKMIHPRMYQLDRTLARRRRTPIRIARTPDYGLGLPSKHVGSLGWGPDPSE